MNQFKDERVLFIKTVMPVMTFLKNILTNCWTRADKYFKKQGHIHACNDTSGKHSD